MALLTCFCRYVSPKKRSIGAHRYVFGDAGVPGIAAGVNMRFRASWDRIVGVDDAMLRAGRILD